MTELKQRDRRNGKHRAVLALCFSFCFLLFLYAPLEIYLTNSTEFWFDLGTLAPVILGCFAAAFVTSVLLWELVCRLLCGHANIFAAIYTLGLALFTGFYVQGNFIPRNYGVLDGHEIDWSSFRAYAIASIVLWIVVAVLAVAVWRKLRGLLYNVGFWICTAVSVMLAVALCSLFPQAEKLFDDGQSIVVTDNKQFELSENKNIVVLLLDTFDAGYMRELLKEDGETYSELLEDFTFYTNAVGGYPTTRASMPLILTQQWYENDVPFEEYVSDAYENCELYEGLRRNDYSIGVYTSNLYLNTEAGFYENVFNGSYQVGDYRGFSKDLYKLVAFEYMPHQLKKYFTVYTGDFDDYSDLQTDGIPDGVGAYTSANLPFYESLTKEGITLRKDGNAFRFYHLRGMHPSYDFGEDLTVDGEEHTDMEAARGNLNIIRALLDELQAKGIYDNTAVIIMADHGGGTLASEMNCNPLFLFKDFGSSHSFEVSPAAVSWEDIVPTLEALASGEDHENAIWNLKDADRERRFLYYSWDDSWDAAYLPTMEEYSITGDISDGSASVIPTGRQFVPGVAGLDIGGGLALPARSLDEVLSGDAEKVKIDIPVDESNDDFQDIVITGLGEIQTREDGTNYAWSKGYYTYFKLDTQGGQYTPYQFTLHFDDIYNPEKLTVSDHELMTVYVLVNGEKIPSLNVTDDSLSFTIPVFEDDSLDIMVFYPHAKAREKGGEQEALAITGITLEEIPISNVLTDHLVIDFTSGGNLSDFIIYASAGALQDYSWNGQEDGGVWSKDRSAISFFCDNSSDLMMQVDYGFLTEDMEAEVSVNGHFVDTLGESGEWISISKKFLNEQEQEIRFEIKGAASPKELGIGEDTRTLGIFVSKIVLACKAYQLGTPLSFAKEDNSAAFHCVSGFSVAEDWGTWTDGNEASMQFYFSETPGDLTLTMESMVYKPQHVILYAGDTVIADYTAEGDETRDITIPAECVSDGEVTLRFELQDATSPKENGDSEDVRKLGLGMKNMVIKEK